MIFHLLLYVVVLPLLAVGSVLYVIKIIEARRHDKTSTWRQILTSEFVQLAATAVTVAAAAVLTLPAVAWAWLRERWRRLRSQFSETAPAAPAAAAGLPSPRRVPAATPRPVAAPLAELQDTEVHPYEVAAINGAPIPPDHAAVMARIAQFEPEDDAAHIAFIRSEGAAFLGYAEAWRSYASTCLDSIGMDPAAVQGTVGFADSVGDTAHDATLALRQFFTVYQQVLEWAANGGRLPHRGRWLTGGGA